MTWLWIKGLWTLVGTKVGRVVAGALAVISLLLGVFLMGKQRAREDQANKEKDSYIEIKRKSDEVPVTTDRESALKRLRRFGHVRKGD